MDVYFDPGRKYSAPYMYGTTGIAYDPTKTGVEITSWADFFDANSPAAGSFAQKCGNGSSILSLPGLG